MTAILRMTTSESVFAPAADNDSCSPIICKDCGIYGLCKEVNGSDVDLRLPETIVRNRRLFERGELLFRSDEPVRTIYAVRSGSVKTYVLTKNGRMQITGFHIAGELLGLGAIAAHYFTTEAMALISRRTFPIMEMNPSTNAFSVSVRVSAKEFLNILSTAAAVLAARSGLVSPMM